MRRHHLTLLFGLTLVVALGLVGIKLAGHPDALASNDASFSLSTSGSSTVGQTLIVTIFELSSSGDNVNNLQANLSYPTAKLQYEGQSLTGPFTICTQQTGGSGSVAIGCASPTIVNSSQSVSVAQISFQVLASGTATIAMASGSDIGNSSGANVWNGTLPSTTLTLVTPATPTPTPTPTPVSAHTPTPTPTSSSTSSTSHATGSTSSTPTPTTKSGTTSTPGSSSTASSGTQSSSITTPSGGPAELPPSHGSLSIRVTTAQGLAAVGATVGLDGSHFVTANTDGVANFAGVASGTHTISVTEPGQRTTKATVSLGAGENKLVALHLTPATSSAKWVILAILILIFGGIIGGGLYAYLKWLRPGGPSAPTAPGSTSSGSSSPGSTPSSGGTPPGAGSLGGTLGSELPPSPVPPGPGHLIMPSQTAAVNPSIASVPHDTGRSTFAGGEPDD